MQKHEGLDVAKECHRASLDRQWHDKAMGFRFAEDQLEREREKKRG